MMDFDHAWQRLLHLHRALPSERERYYALWAASRCDELPGALRFEVLDLVAEQGHFVGTTLLQGVVGVADDGIVTPYLLRLLASGDAQWLLRRLQGLRLQHYMHSPAWSTHGGAWLARLSQNMLAQD